MNQTQFSQQLDEAFKLQAATNDFLYTQWKGAGIPWEEAIFMFSGEFLQHLNLGWKLTKQPNIKQAQLQLVEIFHFLLSKSMDRWLSYKLNTPAGVRFLSEILCDTLVNPAPYDDTNIGQARTTILTLNQAIAHSDNLDAWESWTSLCHYTGLSWREIRAQFIGKSALLRFRETHGGNNIYQKKWKNRADTEYLSDMVTEVLTLNLEPSLEWFTLKLNHQYQRLWFKPQ